jgi:CheY-like chemotaxis protein
MATAKAYRRMVVIVDDEPDFSALVEGWLAPTYRVASFSDPDIACERVRELEPDVVLLDVNMPGRDGFDICRRLRAEPRFAYLPIIFLTGSRSDGDFVRYLEMGGTRYMNKPIDRRALLDVLSDQLGWRRLE